jgi:hyperosmotically inducible periplasmic protein
MQIKRTGPLTWALAALAFPIVVGTPLATHAQDQASPPSSTAPDNSARNKAQTRTADNQKENTQDRQITQKIRRSITADKTLSTYAHNVKIITQGGEVTLKGPVQSDSEKQMIASKAADVVGAEKVNNQLTVKQ